MKTFIRLIYRSVIPEAVRAALIRPVIKKFVQQVFRSRRMKLIREAEMEMQAEKWTEAIQCWQNLLNEYKKNAPAGIYIKLSRSHRKQGDRETAATVAQQGYQLYPEEIKFAFELAGIAEERSFQTEAIHYWQLISDTLKQNTPVGIFIKLARAYRNQDNLKTAEVVKN